MSRAAERSEIGRDHHTAHTVGGFGMKSADRAGNWRGTANGNFAVRGDGPGGRACGWAVIEIAAPGGEAPAVAIKEIAGDVASPRQQIRDRKRSLTSPWRHV